MLRHPINRQYTQRPNSLAFLIISEMETDFQTMRSEGAAEGEPVVIYALEILTAREDVG